MKQVTLLLIGLAVLGGLYYLFASTKGKSGRVENIAKVANKVDTAPANQHQNVYEGLRNMALNITPDQLQLTIPDNQTKVYGSLMDWDLGNGIATVICFSTGDASMYLSSGGGMIGAGRHENVSRVVKKLIENSQSYLDKTTKTESTPLPNKNRVNFYFLTNKGKYFAGENLVNFENRSSVWLPLFEGFNSVINELRSAETDKQ